MKPPDYSIEDEAMRNCKHESGAWYLDDLDGADMYICPDCGAVLAYGWELNPIRTSSSGETLYVFANR